MINKENTGTSSSTILEIDVNIINDKFVTKLYDKRTDFNFTIVKYPMMSSNIHSSTVYNTFYTELISITRVSSIVVSYIADCKTLYTKMVSNGCKPSQLHTYIDKLFKHEEFLKGLKLIFNTLNRIC